MIGAIIIFVMTNGLVRIGIPGYITSAITGVILLAAIGVDVKWSKNRGKIIQKIYVNPAVLPLSPAPSIKRGSGSPYQQNDRLVGAEAIGLDQVEGPEDVILDRQDRLYGSTRDGNIIRFSGKRFEKREVFAHIGGRPYGMQFDRDENLIVCVGGMGVYGVKPSGEVFKVTDETGRTWTKLNDDLRVVWRTISISQRTAKFISATARRAMRQPIIRSRSLKEGPMGGCCVMIRRLERPASSSRTSTFPTASASPTTDGRSLSLPRPTAVSIGTGWRDRAAARRNSYRRSAGPSRQHQPRLRRQLLAGAGRHPRPLLRSLDAQSGISSAHGKTGAAGRVAWTKSQLRLCREIR